MFETRASFEDRDRVQVWNEEGSVRIAHIDRGGLPGEVQAEGVHGAGKRDIAPIQMGYAHVDLDLPVRTADGREVAGDRADGDCGTAGFTHQNVGDATGSITAGAGLRTVRVGDVYEGV